MLQTRTGWEKEWAELSEHGQPLPNLTACVSKIGSQNVETYCVMPEDYGAKFSKHLSKRLDPGEATPDATYIINLSASHDFQVFLLSGKTRTTPRQTIDWPISKLPSMEQFLLDAEDLSERGRESALQFIGLTYRGLRVWVIDRNDFYKSSPSLAEPDRMKLVRVLMSSSDDLLDSPPVLLPAPPKPAYRLAGFMKRSGVWVDYVEPGMPIETFRTGNWETVVCNVYGYYKAYSMALVTYPAANQPYFWQKATTVVGWPDGLANLGRYSDPYIYQFNKSAEPNYYYIESQLDSSTKALVFIGYNRYPVGIYSSSIDIVLMTCNSALTVYSDRGHIDSFDFSSGNFHMSIIPDKNATQKKKHRIYQKGGELWLQEL